MKLAIISDIHNNELNLKKVLDFCAQNQIEKIICCGDLASQETLDFLCDNFAGEIFYTFGNMDNDHLRNFEFVPEYKNAKLFKDFGEAEVAGNPVKSASDHGARKIAFVHFPNKAKKLAETGKYDFIFFGHTHKPWVSYAEASEDQGKKKCTLLNPGNVTGDLYPPTFAVWNTEDDKFELVRIHNLK